MELEVEAKIKEEGTGLCTMWVWEKRQWALMYTRWPKYDLKGER